MHGKKTKSYVRLNLTIFRSLEMKKTTLATAVGLILGGAALNANAALTSSATLSFTLGSTQTVACTYGTTPPCNKAAYNITDVVGSYFSMDTNGNGVENSEKTAIGSLNGIIIGATQAASGSHPGAIDGSESPNIDSPWTFFGGTGMHQTTAPITFTGGSGSTVDMSGWNVAWNGIASIPLVQQSASITCSTASCSDTSTYTLDGAFHVNGAGFTTVAYTVHLEGTVAAAAVPVPAAVWLFGSGLLGLAGVARRKKA
jgi:hypothetical protein